jgi:hopene-associated glycosyltransferase HpnB
MSVWLALPGLILWGAILLLPWQPWRTRERLESGTGGDESHPRDITVLIPARDEADVIARTLASVKRQGAGLKILVVDDQSRDDTAARARRCGAEVIQGKELSAGWTGKLWALEQGRRRITTARILLLDADIELQPGLLAALERRMAADGRALVSVMATLAMRTPWERLLLPAFIYFFKLLYPFRLSNSRFKGVAAAAGGCVLLETRALEAIGGFGALRGAVIDDCTLARRVKAVGFRTWVGLSRGVTSLRRYPHLTNISHMVTRSAYAQLRYSPWLLAVCTGALACAFWLPLAALALCDTAGRILAGISLLAMITTYLPVLRYYGQSPAWALTLPLAGTLYLGMTWLSALKYWRGIRSQWKARTYGVDQSGNTP